jgi:hypothetical protein
MLFELFQGWEWLANSDYDQVAGLRRARRICALSSSGPKVLTPKTGDG